MISIKKEEALLVNSATLLRQYTLFHHFQCMIPSRTNESNKRSDFHFSELNGVVVAMPGVPFHSIGVGTVRSIQVEAVQVGNVTLAIPPASFVSGST